MQSGVVAWNSTAIPEPRTWRGRDPPSSRGAGETRVATDAGGPARREALIRSARQRGAESRAQDTTTLTPGIRSRPGRAPCR